MVAGDLQRRSAADMNLSPSPAFLRAARTVESPKSENVAISASRQP